MLHLFLGTRRFSFVFKCGGALALVALADLLFYDKRAGSTYGIFLLAWTLLVGLTMPGVRRHRGSKVALACAGLLSLAQADAPGLLTTSLFWTALSSAVLLPRVYFYDALQWSLRLLVQGLAGLGKIIRDASYLLRLPRPRLRNSALALFAALGLPLAGAITFLTLFANANPVLELLLSDIPLPSWDWFSPWRISFWIMVAMLVWPTLRPSRTAVGLRFLGSNRPLNLPGVNVLSVILSLALFNAIFALENGLDAAFLLSGARLPQGMSMTDYVHRGAYPLIVTALLAGLFVLMTARPDSEIGRNRAVRWLVVAWTAQNLILVASSAARTMAYVHTYMMTELRLAALIWMGLVAISLVLICWRMIARLSLRWLINAVALTAAIILGSLTVIDLDVVAAEWNATHAREVGADGPSLDLSYMHELRSAALVPLAKMETTKLPPEFRDRVASVRAQIAQETNENQAGSGWSWRKARRLNAMTEILGPNPPKPAPAPVGRGWDGTQNVPAQSRPAPQYAPLTLPGAQ